MLTASDYVSFNYIRFNQIRIRSSLKHLLSQLLWREKGSLRSIRLSKAVVTPVIFIIELCQDPLGD